MIAVLKLGKYSNGAGQDLSILREKDGTVVVSVTGSGADWHFGSGGDLIDADAIIHPESNRKHDTVEAFERVDEDLEDTQEVDVQDGEK